MQEAEQVLPRILDFTKSLMAQTLKEGDVTIDATLGNGYDALFLRRQVGSTGFVWGFDIQETALKAATIHFNHHFPGSTNHSFVLKSHANMREVLGEGAVGSIGGVMFNLGYLPGSDKTVVTQSDTTLSALEQAIKLLRIGGLLTVVAYPGHVGGAKEAIEVLRFFMDIPAKTGEVVQYQFLNKQNPAPFLLAMTKK
ncbi:MAG: methyltransferase domain-containing protein [Bacteroidetes Order II. Incertae sedis bacterium]|nr:methyltransferase domain-containing protein [Bacteroidetes Order II. bacterium]